VLLLSPQVSTGNFAATFIEDRELVSIVELSGGYEVTAGTGEANFEPRAVIAQEFFRTHPDEYDFLVVFTTFDFDREGSRAFHWLVRNDVAGIGLPDFDNSEIFGSASKLQGFVDLGDLAEYVTDPLDPEFETGLTVLGHELMHRWGARVNHQLPDGSISDALVSSDRGHWSLLLDTQASLIDGNDWRANGDGTFTSVGIQKFLSPLDLYLAGFFAPEEASDFTLIENVSVDRDRPPEPEVTISGNERLSSTAREESLRQPPDLENQSIEILTGRINARYTRPT
jgi:hypothetical protein